MSDRPRTQQRLAADLSSLLSILAPANFLGFVRAFWRTMTREWAGIDSLRMDKFLFLVRCYVREAFAYLARRGWGDEEARKGYLHLLAEGPLNPKDPKVPGGLRYHVVDVFVEELDKVDVERNAPVEKLVSPLRRIAKEGLTKALRKKAEEALDDGRLEDWQNAHNGEEEEDDDEEDGDEVPKHETETTLTNDGDHKHETGGLEGLEDGDEFEGFDD